MKRFTLVFFLLFAISLGVFFVFNTFYKESANETVRAKLVIPATTNQTEQTEDTESYSSVEFENTSLVQLNLDETLITTLSIDINSDTFEDQIIAVKKANNPNIVLVIGLYNSKSSEYERFTEIQTPIFQVKTFNIMIMDLAGNHTNSLVCTGFTSNNDSILQAYNPKIERNRLSFTKIIDLQTDGTIFIQQAQRNDNYSIYNMNAECFPIIMYSTEELPNSTDYEQVQTTYEWNNKTSDYQITSTTRLSSKKIAAKELARILDGNVSTFTNFLDGLWYRPGTSGESRYLFFDPKSEEIIFFDQSIQEVYDWLNSTLRKTGIYISASNKSISNLVRYFDIALVSVDEIRIRVRDDVRMVIGTDTLWDGVYKKTSQNMNTIKTQENKIVPLVKNMEEGAGKWNFQNNTVVFAEGVFTLTDNTTKSTGVYTTTTLFNTDLIQFKADDENCLLNGFFMYKINEDRIDFIPVTVTTSSCIIEGSAMPIRMEKYTEN